MKDPDMIVAYVVFGYIASLIPTYYAIKLICRYEHWLVGKYPDVDNSEIVVMSTMGPFFWLLMPMVFIPFTGYYLVIKPGYIQSAAKKACKPVVYVFQGWKLLWLLARGKLNYCAECKGCTDRPHLHISYDSATNVHETVYYPIKA